MDEVQLEVHDSGVSVITLNRPKALNALNDRMVEALLMHFSGTSGLAAKARCLVLQGAGGKAYCAGGDVKSAVLDSMAGRVSAPLNFFRTEYRMNLALARFKLPTVALIDGIVMGGGVGVSVHAPFRVATERTVFAMPECGIGLFPDVGASYFLNTCPGRIGLYLGLTGARLTGVEVKEAGLATHCIASSALPLVVPHLQQLGAAAADLSQVHKVLCSLETQHPPPPLKSPVAALATATGASSPASKQSTALDSAGASATSSGTSADSGVLPSGTSTSGIAIRSSAAASSSSSQQSVGTTLLSRRRALIDSHFGHDTLDEVVASLQRSANAAGVSSTSSNAGGTGSEAASESVAFAKETLSLLEKGSPLSQAITFKLLRRSRHSTLASCLETDWALVGHFVAGDGDFFEGVRATLIDRGTKPAWKYASLADVPPEVVDGFFELKAGVAPLFVDGSTGAGTKEPVPKL